MNKVAPLWDALDLSRPAQECSGWPTGLPTTRTGFNLCLRPRWIFEISVSTGTFFANSALKILHSPTIMLLFVRSGGEDEDLPWYAEAKEMK